MQKRPIKNSSRRAIAIFLAILFLGSAAGVGWSYSRAATTTEEVAVYSYEQEAKVDYQVHLYPNQFFPATAQLPGKAYISGLTDYISTVLEYRFDGEREAEISGECGVVATLTAYVGEEKVEVWNRAFNLVAPKEFSGTNGETLVRETVRVPFAEYAELVAQLRNETGFNPSDLSLTVRYNITVEAETDSGTIQDELSPTLVIPMDQRVFTVGGSTTAGGPGSITEERTVSLRDVERFRIGFTAAAGIVAIALAAFLMTTRGVKSEVDPAAQELERFLNDHGDRVIVSREASALPDRVIAVDSFEDLARAADELEKPFLCLGAEDSKISFAVLTGNEAYLYSLAVPSRFPVRNAIGKRLASIYGGAQNHSEENLDDA